MWAIALRKSIGALAKIVRAVERKGLTSDTLICFTSDHGPWYQGNPGGLRGRKGSSSKVAFAFRFSPSGREGSRPARWKTGGTPTSTYCPRYAPCAD